VPKTVDQLIIEAKRAQRPPQLPLWPELKHAIPTDFVRSALFTARHDRDQIDVKRQIIASADDIILEYDGRLLTQRHADVWERLMYRCRVTCSPRISFRARSMLIEIAGGDRRRKIGGSQFEQLYGVLEDLAKASITLQYISTGELFIGSLITLKWRADESYEITVPEDIVHLFHEKHVLINWEQRRLIHGRLAQWLQHYFAASLEPVKVSTIRRLSDSQTKDSYRFRQAVKLALDELCRVGVISRWDVQLGYVLVSTDPSGALPAIPVDVRGTLAPG
jgi:TrfA protein